VTAPALHLSLPAEAASARASRRAVTDWLRDVCGLAALCEIGEDLVLAVNEAVTNSVEHAYGFAGEAHVELSGEVDEPPGSPCRTVRITVRDKGGWKAPQDSGGLRGRGMALIEMLVDGVSVDASDCGTTVSMRRRVDCALRAALA
jgi:serine/threonine-protein kinase RsbW